MHRLARVLVLFLMLALPALAPPAAAQAEDGAAVKRGQYLALAGDCIACHTAVGGKPMAGGLVMPSPIGNIVSTNITPSRIHGIGNYSLEQFSAAVRKGVRADGAQLYPAMPYPSYALVSDEDMADLYAFFMRGVDPVDTAPAGKTELPFPFNVRMSMAAWNLLFLGERTYRADTSKSAEWNRGAYLARGLAHCGACHTPRNMFMAEDQSRELGGAFVGPWLAPNITSDERSGVGGWSVHELVDYMRFGHASGKGQASGPMLEAVDNSLRYLSEPDLLAMAVYLKELPAVRSNTAVRPAYSWGAASPGLQEVRGTQLPREPDKASGEQLYDAHCATCHQARGEGTPDGGMPPLFHNTTVGHIDTSNLVLVILDGIRHTGSKPEVTMPGFADMLSDTQVATLGAYLIKHFGNPAAVVTEAQVRQLRARGEPSGLVTLARVAIVLAVLVLAGLVYLLVRRLGFAPGDAP
jgi:mono/diheme cytochrome c family protein